MEKQIEDRQQIINFVNGGKAIFTLVSKATNTRYTYKIKAAPDKTVSFVHVMYGPDNTSDYAYLGILKNDTYSFGRKSKLSPTDPRNVAISWFLGRLFEGMDLSKVEFWHEGRCACCGRRLTVPSSIESGIGPECARRVAR